MTYVRWERVEKYFRDFEFATSGEDFENEYIPENIFYLLAMKGESASAVQFQLKVANKILPAIRKHGGYLTPQKAREALSDPRVIRDLANKALELEGQLALAQPKVAFYDDILRPDNTQSLTSIAKDYPGMTTQW